MTDYEDRAQIGPLSYIGDDGKTYDVIETRFYRVIQEPGRSPRRTASRSEFSLDGPQSRPLDQIDRNTLVDSVTGVTLRPARRRA